MEAPNISDSRLKPLVIQLLNENSKNTAIKVGHILIARNAKGVLYWGKIESMQINNIPTEEVTAEQAVAIGIKTTFKVKPQYNYYIYWDKYV